MLFKMLKLVKPLILMMILAILMGVIGHLLASFITILGGYAILNGLGFNTLPLQTIFSLMMIFALLRGLFRYIEQASNHYIAFKLLAMIRDKVFKVLRTLAPAKLEVKEKGDLISMITSDIELLEVFYAHTISPIFIYIIYSLIMIMFLSSYHYALGIVALLAYIMIGIIIPMITSKYMKESGEQLRKQSANISSFVLESLRGINQIIQYNFGNNRITQMNYLSDQQAKAQKQFDEYSGHNQGISQSMILLFDFLMLVVSITLYQNDLIEFDGLLISNITLMSSFATSLALSALGATLSNTLASAKRVFAILEEKPQVEDVVNQEEIEFNDMDINDLSFAYNDELILKELNFKIKKNEMLGLIGPSGCGKSTFLKLLMRFWKVNDGSIEINKKSIEQINTSNLRRMQSYMTQDTHLFHDSILNNIKIAKQSATLEEVKQACIKANIHDFIESLPNKYDTTIKELGESLSQGERQRIALARVFLHDSDLMLLDEPTSNLDSLNEAMILKSLKESRKDKTIIMVTHRKSCQSVFDRIIEVSHDGFK